MEIVGSGANYAIFTKNDDLFITLDIASLEYEITPDGKKLLPQIKGLYYDKLMSRKDSLNISTVENAYSSVTIYYANPKKTKPEAEVLIDDILQEAYNEIMLVPTFKLPEINDYYYYNGSNYRQYRVIKYLMTDIQDRLIFIFYKFKVVRFSLSKPKFDAYVYANMLLRIDIIKDLDVFRNDKMDEIVVRDVQYNTTGPSTKIDFTLNDGIVETLEQSDFLQKLSASGYYFFKNRYSNIDFPVIPMAGLRNVNKQDESVLVNDIEMESGIQPNMNDKVLLDQYKNEVSQLIFLRSIISPIDFEQKITISQLISDKQKKINELNFKALEDRLGKEDIFDDLFEQSFIPIQGKYDGVFSSSELSNDFFAPDGQKSVLSDQLNELIRTPQFIEWFGDWQLSYIYKNDEMELDCSKVLSKNFEPLVVWHGTGQEFSYFRFDNFPAAYFAVKQEYSQWFANLHGDDGGYTIPFFLNVRNPLDLTHFGSGKVSVKNFFDFLYLKTGLSIVELDVNPIFLDNNFPDQQVWVFIRNNPAMLKLISDKNIYDGIHFYETNPNVPVGEPEHETEAYITFNPNQSKIADPNRGLIVASSLKSFLLKEGGKI